MKVAFNILPTSTGHKTRGIGFYTKNLLEELKKRSSLQIQEFTDLGEVKDAEVVHYPYFELFNRTLPLSKKFPTVVTVHDTTPLLFPKAYPPSIKGLVNLFWQKMALKNIAAVITDSENSKKDINKFLGVAIKKIFSIPLAPSAHFKKIQNRELLNKIKQKYSLPNSFALYVGDVNWNKNLLNITQACQNIGVDLVLVGKSFEKKEDLNHPELKSYRQFLKKFSPNSQVHMLGFIEEEELVIIYNLAVVTLLPSFYEGFGLPILESQACGTPVVTSDVSSMPEVAGEGALLVNPYKVAEIEKVISSIWDDASLRLNLIKKGFDNVKKFSWEKTAAETIKVYQYVIDGEDH